MRRVMFWTSRHKKAGKGPKRPLSWQRGQTRRKTWYNLPRHVQASEQGVRYENLYDTGGRDCARRQ